MRQPRSVRSAHSRFVKRLLDLVLTTVVLVVALPVMAAAAIAVLIFDGRPVLFRQERVGRDGVPFTILKFRTMVRGAERMLDELRSRNERRGPLFKLTGDPRVTGLGRLLRESSVDELPQLLNVLRGHMSLVGPRPALPAETSQFGPDLARTRQRVRPGITGLWQVRARHEPSFEAYERLDRLYVEHRTIRLDLAILVLTVPVVVGTAVRRLTHAGAPIGPRRRAGVAGSLPWPSTLWYQRSLHRLPELRTVRVDAVQPRHHGREN
jgi:lipopolysaccharide/colanic/teichoic acid biosynthesis glycosyltransferase